MTQLARVGEARRIEIESAQLTVTPSFVMSGSMLAGTAEHRLDGVTTTLAITAPGVDPDLAASLVDQAERMCFVLDALQRPHTVERSTWLNGVVLG